jgi:cytochrome c oxidase subunit 2
MGVCVTLRACLEAGTMKLVLVALLSMVAVCGCSSVQRNTSLAGMPPDAPVERVQITAKRYEFSPDPIRVKQGSHVILEAESLDVTHGLAIGDYGIDVTLPPHQKVTVEFYAKDAGEYPIHCSEFCGLRHLKMRGKLVVEPSAASGAAAGPGGSAG